MAARAGNLSDPAGVGIVAPLRGDMLPRSTSSRENSLLGRAVANALRYPEALYRLLSYVLLAVFLVTALFPLYWLLVLAVTPPGMAVEMGLLPETVSPINFLALLDVPGMAPFPLYVLNSVLIALAATAIVLVVGSMVGYVFGRLDFPGRTPLLVVTLAIAYFPPVAFLVPLFQLFTGNVAVLGVSSPFVYNSMAAIVFPLSGFTLPLAIFVLSAFYAGIPDGLEDAARVEGATRLGALVRVIVPLSRPGVATAGVLTFVQVYNEFFFSFLMTDGRVGNGAPIVPALVDLREFGPTFAAAASVVALVPVAVLLLFADEQFVRAIDAGRFT